MKHRLFVSQTSVESTLIKSSTAMCPACFKALTNF